VRKNEELMNWSGVHVSIEDVTPEVSLVYPDVVLSSMQSLSDVS